MSIQKRLGDGLMPKIIDFIDKKIPGSIINFISFLSGIIGIITGLCSLIKPFVPENNSLYPFMKTISDSRFLLVISTVFVFLLFVKCCIYYRDARQRLYGYARSFHEFTHQFRDLEFSLKMDLQKGAIRMSDVVERIAGFTTNMLDSLCTIISEIIKQPVYGCIKLIDSMNQQQVSINDITMQTVSTFRRSSNTPEVRTRVNTQHKDFIRDNTDFMELIDYNNIRNQFYQPDLIEYDAKLRVDDHEYKNSSSDWKDKYLSSVVIPIQISNRYIDNEKEEGHNVIGFLCLDSPAANSFKRKFKIPICDFVKAYADLLYCVFDLYEFCLNQIVTNEYKEKFKDYVNTH